MSRTKLCLALASLTAVLFAPALGRAQICASNADCAQGTTCQGAGATPTPEPASKTAPGAVDLVARTTCQPAPCVADADCGGELVCHVETYSTCSGGSVVACPANAPCDVAPTPPPPTTCTQTKTSACAYRWQFPCNTDSDCGAAFVCMPSVTGTCSGSGGTGTAPSGGGGTTDTPGTGVAAPRPPAPADGGTTGGDPATPPTCTTTTSFPGYCQPRAASCVADTDCPAKWTCVAQDVPVSTTPTPGGTDPADAPDAPGAAAPRVAPTKACQPPAAFPVKGGVAVDTAGVPSTPPTTTGGEGTSRASAGDGACALGPGTPSDSGSTLALGGLALWGLVLRRSRRARR